MQEVTTYEREYITGEKRKQQSYCIYKTINGEEHLATYAYYDINKNIGKEYNSKDAFVCEHYLTGEYAISNNDHHMHSMICIMTVRIHQSSRSGRRVMNCRRR